jgi:four helix bundle protein
MAKNTYKDLVVWQKAMDLTVEVYKLTERFPDGEKYGLVSQMRRCSVSIPSNIAEGKLRGSDKERDRFFAIAFASGGELETQIELSKRLRYISDKISKPSEDLLSEVMKMLNAFI